MEIVIDLPLLQGFMEDRNITINPNPQSIRDEFYKRFEIRLTKSHQEFMSSLGKHVTRNSVIKPIEYIFDHRQLNNIVFICYYYMDLLSLISGENFIGEIRKDIKQAQLEYQEMKKFLEKTEKFKRGSSTIIDIWIGGEQLKMESHAMMRILTNILMQLENKIEYFPGIVNVAEDVFTINDGIQKEFGKGKNPVITETQELTWKLFHFLENKKTISSISGKPLNKTMYYKCIADLYTLMDLPTMNFGNDSSKIKSSLSWSFLSKDYNQSSQVKRIESWIYNYENKMNLS